MPFVKYCRRRPLVFSFEPRCQGLCGDPTFPSTFLQACPKADVDLRLLYMGKPGRVSRPMRWETARVGRAHGNDFRLQPRLPREDGKVLKR